MTEPIAFLNGQYIPAAEAVVSVDDTGFVQGVTVSERLRTFGGRLFELEHHLDRLERSLEIVGVRLPLSRAELTEAAERLVAHNHPLLESGDDLGLALFVTPGAPSMASPSRKPSPTVCLHSCPLPFWQWSELYQHGQALVVTEFRQVPPSCWPAELKCRSRMHYYLADREANRRQPGARALLLDQDGFVSEASTANIVIYHESRGLVSPPTKKILPGISIAVLGRLALQLGISFTHADLTVDDVSKAREVMLCSTSPCVWPIVQLDVRNIADGKPGPVFRQLLAAWSDLVGLDIAAQARRFAVRTGAGGVRGER